MKVNWRWVPAVAALLLVSGCSQGSKPHVSPSSTSTVTASGSIDHSAVYTQAAMYIQSFLASWQKIGFYAAGQKYLDRPSGRSILKEGNPVLIAGTMANMQQYSWVSADHFTVKADLDLQFSGGAGAWGNGVNTLFVTFVRSSASTPYQMTLNTSPPGPMDHSAVYTEATAYLQSFLDSWRKNGLYAAGQKYLEFSSRTNQKQGNPVLIAGTVKLMQPYSWISADNFMVFVRFDLRFSKGFSEGDGGWGSGSNDQFVIFVRSSTKAPYQMSLATGP